MRLVGSRLLAGIFLVAVCGAASAAAAPGLGRPGHTLSKVSAAVPATGIAQLAFRPGDTTHVYAARVSGVVTRYDYDPVTGQMANALDVSRSRVSLDTSLGGMMLPQGGGHEQTEARPEVARGRDGTGRVR
jgi:hypothetical protein